MSKEICSEGESFVVAYLNRKYAGGPAVDVLRVNGDIPKGPLGQVTIYGHAVPTLHGYAVGLASAGSVTVPGTKVGDSVAQVLETTTPFSDVTANFEKVVTVAGHVRQTGATDLHLFTLMFVIGQNS
jgi:hypothetical protein